MQKRFFVLAGLALLTLPATAEIQGRDFEYEHDGTTLVGYIAWQDAMTGKRPGMLVVHEWWGHNEHVRNQARRLAEAGVVGMALDMYGKGRVTEHPDEAQAFMQEATSNMARLQGRFEAALDILKQDPRVDSERIGAIGYCFGGAVVLGMARSGMDLDLVASFHGALQAPSEPTPKGQIKARVLVFHGAADPLVPPEAVAAFKKDMEGADAAFELIEYEGAKHAFTNPDADKKGMEALAYDADADALSWLRLLEVLEEVIAEGFAK